MASLKDIFARIVGLDEKLDKLAQLQGAADALAKLPSVESALASANAELASVKSALASANEAKAKAESDFANLQAAHKETEAKIGQLEAEAKTAAAKAVDILAKAGHAAIPEPKGNSGQNSQMTRAEFSRLSARAQSDFCKNGGKLID